MLIIRSRDEMKAHLLHRLRMVEGEKKKAERQEAMRTAQRLSFHVLGIKEALECIEAWEQYEKNTQQESEQ